MSTVSESDRLAAAVHVADSRAAAGDLAGARAVLAGAFEAAAVALGRDHLDVLSAARSLAGLHRGLGEPADARRLLEEAQAAGARTHGEGHPLLLAVAYELATLVDELGNTYEARRNFDLVANRGPGVLGADHAYVVAARRYLDQDAPTSTAVAAPPQPPPAPVPPAGRRRPVLLLAGVAAVVLVAAATAAVAVVAFRDAGTGRATPPDGKQVTRPPATTTAGPEPAPFSGRYAIRVADTGMCLGEGPELFKDTGRTVLGQHPCATASPPTILEPAGAAYRIKLDHPVDGLGCATVDYGGAEAGLLLAGASCEAGRADQTFTLEPVTSPVTGYRLRSVPGRRFCIGVFEASRQSGVQLIQTTCGGGADQIFTLERP